MHAYIFNIYDRSTLYFAPLGVFDMKDQGLIAIRVFQGKYSYESR